MENKKIYGFFGTPANDFLIYLSSILSNLGNRVLIVDSSKNQEVMSSFSPPEENLDFMQYKDVDYSSVKELNGVDTKGYQYIFLYFDEFTDNEINFDVLFVLSDCKKINLKNASNFINEWNGEIHFILRDFCNDKLNVDYILKEFFNNEIKVEQHVIELDTLDYAYRISMNHEFYQGFQHLSKNYKKCLLKIIVWMENPPKKILNKAYRLAERGKCSGNSFLE